MIVVSGGGTGGHLAIAKTLAKELKDRGLEVVFIGSSGGQDKMWFEHDEGFGFKYFLPSSGVVNKSGFQKLSSLINIIKLAFACKRVFKKHGVQKVISVGGYSSAPASIAAILFGKKLYIHEQNAVCGRLNLLLKPFCTKFFSSYSKNPYSYPVSDKFFDSARIRQNLKTILFLGGSQGASFINSLALNLAPNLDKNGIKIIHQCGKKELESVKESYEKLGINATIFDFSKDIQNYMQEADLAISRSGASSLWELCANSLPAIFIPYPYAAKNHQYFNAKFLEELGLAQIYKQGEINTQDFMQNLLNLDLEKMSRGLEKTILKDGSKKIIDEIL
ncbi:N-acetylglucosaminyl transferase [Campylobacter iguaniorum]|uniref:undecaprenyldiphospho-muramoylpentapeptide beta-N-acetylglucosaminyltransferase n=1 Tax=Campylobacter iguaniorum TaxID=1244531 RepID=UPI0007C8C4E1|nr:undecaprenyldiphospho-muramoylpentapeptide beta-N-acetylglucosaminyltransferase [Campylobacter iguaniorum]ANE35844.1 N-acetylglucosaminyl transferase [Campylobacter iguaniorum]